MKAADQRCGSANETYVIFVVGNELRNKRNQSKRIPFNAIREPKYAMRQPFGIVVGLYAQRTTCGRDGVKVSKEDGYDDNDGFRGAARML